MQEKRIKCLIIENCFLCSIRLERPVSKLKDIKILDVVNDEHEAIRLLPLHEPNLIIINDINSDIDAKKAINKLSRLTSISTFVKLSDYVYDSEYKNHEVIYEFCSKISNKHFLNDVLKKETKKRASDAFEVYDFIYVDKFEPVRSRDNVIKYYLKPVSDYLVAARIPTHLSGYKYIREAILMALENPSVLMSLTKSLYSGIAKKFNATPASVERAIRQAVESAYNKDKFKFFNEFVGISCFDPDVCPTNSEFVSLIIDRVRMKVSLDFIEKSKIINKDK